MCAVVGTAPLTAWHFQRLSLVAVWRTPLVVPLLGWIPVGLGLVAVFVRRAGAGRRGAALAAASAWSSGSAMRSSAVRRDSRRGAAGRAADARSSWSLLYGCLAALLIPRRKLRRLAVAPASSWPAPTPATGPSSASTAADLRVTFLSVGQGDSAVVEFPGSAVMVVDGGGLSATFDVGERVVAPYLWRRARSARSTRWC